MGTLFYLSSVLNQKHLTALARFRTSCHRLAIETGRYHKPPIPSEQRFCCICNTGEIDKEFHLLVKSQSLQQFRESLYDPAQKIILNLIVYPERKYDLCSNNK